MWIQIDTEGRIVGISYDDPSEEDAKYWQETELTEEDFEHDFDDYILGKDGLVESPREGGAWWNSIQEKIRPLTSEEIFNLIVPYLISDFNAMNLIIPAHTAARMVDRYPEWESGKTYALLYRVQYQGKLYRCKLAHISRSSNPPSSSSTYWRLLSPTDTDDEEE